MSPLLFAESHHGSDSVLFGRTCRTCIHHTNTSGQSVRPGRCGGCAGIKRKNGRAVMDSERWEGLVSGPLMMNNYLEQSKTGTRPSWEEEVTKNRGGNEAGAPCECVCVCCVLVCFGTVCSELKVLFALFFPPIEILIQGMSLRGSNKALQSLVHVAQTEPGARTHAHAALLPSAELLFVSLPFSDRL